MAISPLDGRYAYITNKLYLYITEEALIKQKCKVELDYLRFLKQVLHINIDIPELNDQDIHVERIREIEQTVKHDTKSIEIYLQEKCVEKNMTACIPYIHWGLTSWDIVSVSTTVNFKNAIMRCVFPYIDMVLNKLTYWISVYHDTPVMSRTHGMCATPTTLGKEWSVYKHRMVQQYKRLQQAVDGLTVKFGGTVGNCHIHYYFYPDIPWDNAFETWIRTTYGLNRTPYTTQVDSYESWIEVMDVLRRIGGILLDFSKNQWNWISHGTLYQIAHQEEVGSSIMPHKVNPIHWENAEGNITICNGYFEMMGRKLAESRFQRDMSDSTVIRNIGVPLGHFIITCNMICEAMNRTIPDLKHIEQELEEHYEVLMELVQHCLRENGIVDAYEFVRQNTRGVSKMTSFMYHNFIKQCMGKYPFAKDILQKMLSMTPKDYVGCAKTC